MNIIFFTCIFVIEQVYQNKLSTKATGPGCADWNRPLPSPRAQVSPQPQRRVPPPGARRPPTTALRRREAAPPPLAARPLGPARLHRQRRNTAGPPLRAGRGGGLLPAPARGKGRVSAGRCLGLTMLRWLGGSLSPARWPPRLSGRARGGWGGVGRGKPFLR